MTGPRIASLCSGTGALDRGIMSVIGGSVAWHCENDPHAAKVLAARYPGVPNYGDLTAVDWTSVEPVDWLTAGFPCQPASAAGKRKGMDDERWLWDAVARAIQGVRPRRVLLENVPGLLTVDGGRAFERVICDLAAMGYVGRYGVVRASDAGAPHERARVFVVASLAAGEQARAGGLAWSRPGLPAAECRCPHRRGLPAIACCATATGCCCVASDADDIEQPRQRVEVERRPAPARHCEAVCAVGRDWRTTDGRDYGPAIRRWHDLTRCVPEPTVPDGRGGAHRLSPRFTEWMMGLPAGWVTDILPRSPAMKCLGNGCVPAQVALAVRTLLGVEQVAA